jgi:hypothetical protein
MEFIIIAAILVAILVVFPKAPMWFKALLWFVLSVGVVIAGAVKDNAD